MKPMGRFVDSIRFISFHYNDSKLHIPKILSKVSQNSDHRRCEKPNDPSPVNAFSVSVQRDHVKVFFFKKLKTKLNY